MICLAFVGCQSTQNVVVDPVKEKQLQEWIDNKQIRILAETASPIATQDIDQLVFLLPNGSTPNRILLTGGQDYFEMDGEYIRADLAYFGTRQLGGEYNSNRGGIKFDGKYSSFKSEYDEKKKVHKLMYKINDNRESFNVVVKIFPNYKTEMYINTSHRTAINYNGFVSVKNKEDVASK
jgi:hypothetical protein